MKASPYQAAIVQRVRDMARGEANPRLVVEAVAGSGKSTTLRMIASTLRDSGVPEADILYLAFSSAMVKEIGPKLSGMALTRTIHSQGFGAVRRNLGKVDVQDAKVKLKPIVEAIIKADSSLSDQADKFSLTYETINLVQKLMVNLVDPASVEGVEEIVAHYDIDLEGQDVAWASKVAVQVFAAALDLAKAGKISFDDQIWLPTSQGWPVQKFRFVLVDEAQDLSAAQLAIAMASVAPGGNMIFVGDSRQAIFGFAGAQCDSMERIIAATHADTLPLSMTYRCPSAHVALAQQIVPGIEAAPNAPEGVVSAVSEDKLAREVKAGDLVICRTTAPIVSLAFNLIASGIPAQVKGRDIGKGLCALVKRVAQVPGFRFEGFLNHLVAYTDQQVAMLQVKPGNDAKVQRIEDQSECVQAIFRASTPPTLPALLKAITSVFSDSTPGVTLSTVHRAKGLEADRVFIMRPDLLPLRTRSAWQAKQELNLKYVAFTRSRHDLVFVS